jgi:hypothetical protein
VPVCVLWNGSAPPNTTNVIKLLTITKKPRNGAFYFL